MGMKVLAGQVSIHVSFFHLSNSSSTPLNVTQQSADIRHNNITALNLFEVRRDFWKYLMCFKHKYNQKIGVAWIYSESEFDFREKLACKVRLDFLGRLGPLESQEFKVPSDWKAKRYPANYLIIIVLL